MTTHAWQDIRALRAAPTGLAANDEGRRLVLAAALGQAEELAIAAAAVSYAARPLPMFYALSQAGRAIAAAHAQDKYVISGHGLNFERGGKSEPDPKKAIKQALFDRVIPPVPRAEKSCPHCQKVVSAAGGTPRQAFQVVADTIDSPLLVDPAELGALWAANPDLVNVPVPDGFGTWPQPLDGTMEARPTVEGPWPANKGKVRAALDLNP